MPELPEVETTVRGLKPLIGAKITDLWTDWPKYFKLPKNEAAFRRHLVGKTITAVERRGKNILVYLNDSHVLLIHQKLSGHLMLGEWLSVKNKKYKRTLEKLPPVWASQKWIPANPQSPLADPKNRFIRLVFFLKTKNTSMLVLSDLRRFAKLMCGTKEEITAHADIVTLGPEPLDRNFTLTAFKTLFKKRSGRIKALLLDQTFIRGIGNIYADESLWKAKINPLRHSASLKPGELSALYHTIRKILARAVKSGGTSMDDYRMPSGLPGRFEARLNAYHRESRPCPRCRTPIKRIRIGTRSAHFCPLCQPLPSPQGKSFALDFSKRKGGVAPRRLEETLGDRTARLRR